MNSFLNQFKPPWIWIWIDSKPIYLNLESWIDSDFIKWIEFISKIHCCQMEIGVSMIFFWWTKMAFFSRSKLHGFYQLYDSYLCKIIYENLSFFWKFTVKCEDVKEVFSKCRIKNSYVNSIISYSYLVLVFYLTVLGVKEFKFLVFCNE